MQTCLECKNRQDEGAMTEQGFFPCEKLPRWHYVSRNRPACEHFSAREADKSESDVEFDIADLF